MDEELVIGFPTREWAEAAIGDLALEGCRAELLSAVDSSGQWQVRVTGCLEKLAELRAAARPPCDRVDWEAFVNAAVKRF
jgi:hypothetical protein